MSPFLARLLADERKPNLYNRAFRWELLHMRTGKPAYKLRAEELRRRITEQEIAS